MTKILLADDSVTIQKVVELTFSDQASEVTTVSDGAAALEKAQSQRPDIILSDVIMPGMNGYELCQTVKSDPNLKGIPFLFLKGTFESFDEDKARQCGADGFIVKPFESQELINKVAELVNRLAAPETPVAPEAAADEVVPEAVPAPEAPAPPPAELPVTPPVPPPVQPPAPPPAPEPVAAAEPSPAAASVEESFDLGEEDLVEEMAPMATAEPPPVPEAEQEEDLWSEVSLRDSEAPLIEDKVLEDESFWGTADDGDVSESAVDEPAGEDLLAEVGEPEVFDLGTEDIEPAAAAEPAAAEPAPPAAPDISDPFFTPPPEEPAAAAAPVDAFAVEEMEEIPGQPFEAPVAAEPEPEPEPLPAPEPVAPAPAATAAPIDTVGLEKAIAAKIEDAVLRILGPAVEETARKIVEEVAWEVIPDLAEAMIKSEIERIKAENS